MRERLKLRYYGGVLIPRCYYWQGREQIESEIRRREEAARLEAKREAEKVIAQLKEAEDRRREIEEKAVAKLLAKDLNEFLEHPYRPEPLEVEDLTRLTPNQMADRTKIVVPALKDATAEDVVSEEAIMLECDPSLVVEIAFNEKP